MEDKTVIDILFPYSGITKEDYLLKLSYNDAIQSKFIKGIITYAFNTKETKYEEKSATLEIVIPQEIYVGLRNEDLKKLKKLWLGTEDVLDYDTCYYNYKTIYRIADALLLNEELPFMKKLCEKYTKQDIENDLGIYN
jgi:hypothetical protein